MASTRRVADILTIRGKLSLQIGTAAVILALWELASRSGHVAAAVMPSITLVVAATFQILSSPIFYHNLLITFFEVSLSLLIGSVLGLVVGLIVGSRIFLTRAYEPYLYYLSATPKIILFPIVIMWFGIGLSSKVSIGAISSFFPVALSVIAGMRQIDRVFIRVGESYQLSASQMTIKIIVPALRPALITGIRLGFGLALIGVLLAETKLSREGLGFAVIQSFNNFQLASMYAYLIIIFVLAAASNVALNRLRTN